MIIATQDFELTFESKGDYLQAEVIGTHDSYQISLDYWALIAKECLVRNAQRLLVIERLGAHLGDRDMPKLVAEVAAMGINHIRIAFVELLIDDMPDMEYGEILARELGMTGRVFSNVEDAKRWLRHGVD